MNFTTNHDLQNFPFKFKFIPVNSLVQFFFFTKGQPEITQNGGNIADGGTWNWNSPYQKMAAKSKVADILHLALI
jgi:hypothetical protein